MIGSRFVHLNSVCSMDTRKLKESTNESIFSTSDSNDS